MFEYATRKQLVELVRAAIRSRPASNTESLNAACGSFRYQSAANGTIKITSPRWASENIVALTTQEYAKRHKVPSGWKPDLPDWPMTPTVVNGKPGFVVVPQVWCHRLMAPALVLSWQMVAENGLAKKVQTFDGLWVPRHQLFNPARPLSVHSWGMALDLAARWNGYGVKPQLDEQVARIFETNGFAWGGRWRGPRGPQDYSNADGMHFEFCDPSFPKLIPDWQDGVLK